MAGVKEIIRYVEPRSIASDAPWVRGVISLRGKIIPVCELSVRLGHPAAQEGSDAKIVIVETADGTAGIVVDEVDEVLRIERDQLDEAPASGADWISAIARFDERLVVLLDPDRLLAGISQV